MSSQHSEQVTLLRDLIEVMGACTENECDKCHADAQTMLAALVSLEEQYQALQAAARRILDAPKGTSHSQFRFWLMDALDPNPASGVPSRQEGGAPTPPSASSPAIIQDAAPAPASGRDGMAGAAPSPAKERS